MAGQARTSDFALDDKAFLARLTSAVHQLELDGARGLEAVAIDVVGRAKELTPVDTGRLRASETYEMGADARGPYADVGTNVTYSVYVEFGTVHMAPQPAWRPALLEATAAKLARQMGQR
jgi:HK97 gp10 family phage protein